MASFTAGTTFVDGVSNDVTAAKLGALVTNATPTSGFIQDRTAETIIATNDTLLIGDASDSNNLKRITVANFAQTLPTANVTTGTIETGTFGTTTSTAATITTGTIPTGTFGTTTSTAATITTGTIPTLVATTLITTGTGTAAAPAIVPTGDTNTGIFFPAVDTLAATTNGTERLRIDSGGNVGISNTSPSSYNAQFDNLVIGSSGPNGMTIVSSDNNLGTIAFADGTTGSDAYRGYIQYQHTNNLLLLGTDATERLRIDSSGNVGIGTASPRSPLDVNGNIYVAGGSQIQITGSPGTTGLQLFGQDAAESLIGTMSSQALAFRTNATERLRIDSSGKVGIGVTAPVNKLEVVGSFGRGAPVTKTGDFTLADTENWLIVNKGSSCTVTLPAASSWTGREFTIKVITAHTVVSASSNIIPRIGGAAATAILPATDGAWATLVSNGTNWEIMCGS